MHRVLSGRSSRNMLQIGLPFFSRRHLVNYRGAKSHLLRHTDRAPLPKSRPGVLGNLYGGVGKPIISLLIYSAPRPWRGFLDTSSIFQAEEIRNIPLNYRTASFRHLGKLRMAEALRARFDKTSTKNYDRRKMTDRPPPYAVLRNLIAIRQSKRSEPERVTRFPNVTEDTPDIIYR